MTNAVKIQIYRAFCNHEPSFLFNEHASVLKDEA